MNMLKVFLTVVIGFIFLGFLLPEMVSSHTDMGPIIAALFIFAVILYWINLSINFIKKEKK